MENLKENELKIKIEDLIKENKILKLQNQNLISSSQSSENLANKEKKSEENEVIQLRNKLKVQEEMIEMLDKTLNNNEQMIGKLEKQVKNLQDELNEFKTKELLMIERKEINREENTEDNRFLFLSEEQSILNKPLDKFYEKEFKKFIDKNNFIDNDDNYQYNELSKIKKNNVEFGSKCSACNKYLNPYDPQYYCHFCKLWFCEKCGDKDDSIQKKRSYLLIHPHNLVWINVLLNTGMKNIDEYKFGRNITFQESIQQFNAICNLCKSSVNGGFRYICLNCRPGPVKHSGLMDVCETCMNCLRGKKGNLNILMNNKNFLKTMEDEGHEIESHIFLRVCFGDNYYNY